ncbi:oligomeric, coiled-coil, peripheral membrane protein [Microbotryomycetes sp. JL201]|nr:oligomeric, coiled-coil, peripheral membrane protein [Microbotryomycetes sp. JL201]
MAYAQIGLVIAIFGYSYYVTVIRVAVRMIQQRGPTYKGRRAQGIIYIAFYHLLFFMFAWTYVRVVVTGPGYARDFVPQTDPPVPQDAPLVQVEGYDFDRHQRVAAFEVENDNAANGGARDISDPEKAQSEPYGFVQDETTSLPAQAQADEVDAMAEKHGLAGAGGPPIASLVAVTQRNHPPNEHEVETSGSERKEADGVDRPAPAVTRDYAHWSSIYLVFVLVADLLALTLPSGANGFTPDAQVIVVIALAALFALFTLSLWVAHTRLILLNMTTIEEMALARIKARERSALTGEFGLLHPLRIWRTRKAWDAQWGRLSREGNLWWLGSARANWEMVMGKRKLGWFLPIRARPEQDDGLSYQPNPRQPITMVAPWLNELRFNLLGPLLQIPPECLICLNDQGAQLDEASVAGLAALAVSPVEPHASTLSKRRATNHSEAGKSSGEHRVYVFDRDHLENDADEVSSALLITDDDALREPPLDPEDSFESHFHLSVHNLETQHALIQSISLQHASLQLAFSNLERVLATSSSARLRFDNESCRSFETWRSLLLGWQPAMTAVSQVRVLAGLVGKTHARKSSIDSHSGQKDKERYLGDYVNYEKMLAVRDGCAQVLEDLEGQLGRFHDSMEAVTRAVEALQTEFAEMTHDLEDLELCQQDAEKGHERIVELVQAGKEKLSYFDSEHRARIHFLVERKNAMTRYLTHTMQRISIVQSDIAPLTISQGQLEHDMKARTDNFKHLARLENLIPAYVATVAEVVRRRLFAELLRERTGQFLQASQGVSGREREKRSVYRNKYSGQLPWEVKGLSSLADEPDSYISLETRDRSDELPQLERTDLQEVRDEIAAIQYEMDAKSVTADGPVNSALEVCDAALSELDQLALAMQARDDHVDPQEFATQLQELNERLNAAQNKSHQLSQELEVERIARAEEATRLASRTAELTAQKEREEKETDELRRQLELARSEVAKARSEREREQEAHRLAITLMVIEHEKALAYAESSGQDRARQLTDVNQRLSEVQAENARVSGEAAKAASLVVDLQTAVEAAQVLHRETSAQLAEKERELRHLRGEAELERAVLQKEASELQSSLSQAESDMALMESRNNTLEEIAAGLRAQVAKLEKVLSEKEAASHSLRDSYQDAQTEHESELRRVKAEAEETMIFARKALRVAGMRKLEARRVAEVLSTTPNRGEEQVADHMGNSEAWSRVSEPRKEEALIPDYDADSLQELLQHVSDYDVQDLTEAVRGKIEHLTAAIKKYIREARGYRERAQKVSALGVDKIAFRQFTKGDLALFLPTRNSEVPVWAAFNVGFPHHFLAASGIVAEQMKVREWIVARITSITEKVVDPKIASSNPFKLAPGTKYFLLEVEPWSSRDARRRSSSDKSRAVSAGVKGRVKSSKQPAEHISDDLKGTGDQILGAIDSPDAANEEIRAKRSRAGPSFEPIPEDPSSVAKEGGAQSGTLSEPSGLTRSLAAAQSDLNSPAPAFDPFVTSDPFGSAPEPEPKVAADIKHENADEQRNLDATAAPAPAFLPTSGRKQVTSYAESSASSSGPRYVRSSQASSSAQPRGVPISKSRADIHGTARSTSSSLPRSAGSASSILSTLMYRNTGRGATNGNLAGPVPSGSVHLDTSPAVAEAQRSASSGSPVGTSNFEDKDRVSASLHARSPLRPEFGAQGSSARSSVVMDAIAGRRRSTFGSPDKAGAIEAEVKKRLQR